MVLRSRSPAAAEDPPKKRRRTTIETDDVAEADPQTDERSPADSAEGGKPLTKKQLRKMAKHDKLFKKIEAEGKRAEREKEQGQNPRLAGTGNFWRERKEQGLRTLFIGNLPVGTDKQRLLGLIGEDVVRDIRNLDGVPKKGNSQAVHAFVEFNTKQDAEAAQRRLDDFVLHGRALRVNGANDKKQRQLAIQKREGSWGGPDWQPGTGGSDNWKKRAPHRKCVVLV
eukprot:TRINITY_DN8375_c0_g1_i1.p2 TRINITY_DN8375_c0_g1~~TRINITY_DN8375_c0_g1_i1.p2  ORF type:complete len:226 (+),score=69.64 TRINITY_DN8375_c0_g1_i1:58-735(+)